MDFKKVIKVERYGKTVSENTEMESLRKDNCLCLHCDKMKPHLPEEHCKIASSFYEICKAHGNAFILTRCEDFIPLKTV